jgi:hypothetical protein
MAKKRKVGRPKGTGGKKKSDAAKIRGVLEQYGVNYPTKKVKSVVKTRGVAVPAAPSKALDVKIAQVRRELRKELTGVVRKDRGRMTLKELAKVERKLEAA